MNIDIKMIGTEKDARLLKKILRQYAKQTTSATEKECCECYIGLIEHAEGEAK